MPLRRTRPRPIDTPALVLAWVMAVLLVLAPRGARADDVQVAVAANFAGPARLLANDFTRKTGHRMVVSSGATGTFFAQIEAGAPFEVFLAADEATPAKLEADGFAVPGSRAVYAVGRLVLWSAKPGLVDESGAILKKGAFAHLAIANPKLAPYGAAAMQVLEKLGLADALRPKLVVGENIAQTYEFVSTGNAELGFIALSQRTGAGADTRGSTWLVPAHLYTPIVQDLVLLKRGANNPAARALLDYLKSDSVKQVIRASGYATP